MCASLSIADLVSITGCRQFAMLLRTYIDDSFDQFRERVAVAGAFLGSFQQWKALVPKWRRRLKQDGLKYFRSTEYLSLSGQFEKFHDPIKFPKPTGRDRARKIRDDLDAIIHECHIVGFALCVPLRVYTHLRNETEFGEQLMPADPFDYAIQELLIMVAQDVKKHRKGDTVAFFCDEGPSSARIAEIYGQLKPLNPDSAQVMGALTHLDDKQYPQLQTADLMASIAKERFAGWMTDRSTQVPDQALADRLKKLSVYHMGIADRARLLGFIEHEGLTRGFLQDFALSR